VNERRKYRKRSDLHVTAVQLTLETDGFTYRKWGRVQRCKAGDWLVDSGVEVYTVDRESFARTYRAVQPGRYVKIGPVWAERTAAAGRVVTKEGVTEYRAGDYLVSNDEEGTDTYAIAGTLFEAMYDAID
jgi:hypothetical protein